MRLSSGENECGDEIPKNDARDEEKRASCQQEGLTHSEALIREAQIKAMPRSKKEEIIFSRIN
jgi:predicted GIY-YIG superfamily endonuclease